MKEKNKVNLQNGMPSAEELALIIKAKEMTKMNRKETTSMEYCGTGELLNIIASECRKISRQLLQVYERLGLIKPTQWKAGARKQWTRKDIGRIIEICQLVGLGLSLNNVSVILSSKGRANMQILNIIEDKLLAAKLLKRKYRGLKGE